MSLVIIDTGCANLSSVAFAFERLGVQAKISANAETIHAAERVILPGVGSAPFAMKQIIDRGLLSVVKELNQPVLGICLGMQLLFNTLVEGAEKTEGFGVINGDVVPLDTKSLPSPHMGWNTLSPVKQDTIAKGLSDSDFAYFVHSYVVPIGDYTVMSCEYGSPFSAIVRQNNFWGCQFHPERSSATGSKLLKNFLDVTV